MPFLLKYLKLLALPFVTVTMVVLHLFFMFSGFNDSKLIEQAQIAREVARGNGMQSKVIYPRQIEFKLKEDLDLTDNRNTYYAPLPILLQAGALKLFNAQDAEKWKLEPTVSDHVYGPDRIIAGLALVLFIITLFLNRFVLARIFNTKIANFCCWILLFSHFAFDWKLASVSHQLAALLFTIFIYSAYLFLNLYGNKNQAYEGAKYWVTALTPYLILTLLAFTHWAAISLAVIYAIYQIIYYKPQRILHVIALVTYLTVVFAYLGATYLPQTGNIFGLWYYSLYDNLSSFSELAVLRNMDMGNFTIEAPILFKKLLLSCYTQLQSMNILLSSLIIAPLFFLNLLHSFNRDHLNKLKWLLASLWLGFIFSNSFFFDSTTYFSQIHFIFTPVFFCYAIAFIIILWKKTKISQNRHLGNIYWVILTIICSGSFILSFPTKFKWGVLYGLDGKPQWPPYYPKGLNNLNSILVDSESLIFSDQAWATAWYVDITSIQIPQTHADITKIRAAYKERNATIAGVLISPAIFENSSLQNLLYKERDLFKLFLSGPAYTRTLPQAQGMNQPLNLLELSPINSLKGISELAVPLAGGDMMFYSNSQFLTEN